MNAPDTMTVKDVAHTLGLNVHTVYSMLRENRFPIKPLSLPIAKKLFAREAVVAFLAQSNK